MWAKILCRKLPSIWVLIDWNFSIWFKVKVSKSALSDPTRWENRERIFIIGIHKDYCDKEYLDFELVFITGSDNLKELEKMRNDLNSMNKQVNENKNKLNVD